MGAPEALPKALMIVGHWILWPFVGLLNALAIGRRAYLKALLWPNTIGRAWGLLMAAIGVRWVAQEVYRKRHPAAPLPEMIGRSVRRVDMRDAIIAHEGMSTDGVKGWINKVNEMYDLEIVTQEVRVPHLPSEFDGFSMVQISDVHHMTISSAEFIRRYVAMAVEMQPDLIVLTGDYQSYGKDVESAARLLSPIGCWSEKERGGKGVLAVLGNHDREAGLEHVTDALRRAHIRVLSNEHVFIQRGDAHICVVGVSDPWSGHSDLDSALFGVPDSVYKILLAHVPDFLIESAGRVDFQLSGHNHGGQIKLPWLGALLVSSRYGRRYVEGFFKRKGTLMYVSRGIGGKPPIRLGSKPEITRFILRP